ncbi:MAG: winged helix-turn-helix domain-containing protein [Calditerrivibrio sp.]|nr:winged helix-turn-helix domain-containing protein [Calditerrivibrio sp.]MCA1980361.1 winged helix-turn-helix domain-containing protein [Calditerrivibrio sp.]
MKSKPHFKPNKKEKVSADYSVNTNSYELKGRIWIDSGNETFIGYGRIVLLERIKEHGSITKAAKSMDMSYKHAWDLIDSINKNSSKPVVITATGGKNGGGAKLTEHGEQIVKLFWDLQAKLKEFLSENKKLIDNI